MKNKKITMRKIKQFQNCPKLAMLPFPMYTVQAASADWKKLQSSKNKRNINFSFIAHCSTCIKGERDILQTQYTPVLESPKIGSNRISEYFRWLYMAPQMSSDNSKRLTENRPLFEGLKMGGQNEFSRDPPPVSLITPLQVDRQKRVALLRPIDH